MSKIKKTEVVEQNHLKGHHHKNGETKVGHKRREISPTEKMFCCHICGETFLHKTNMNAHIRIHEGYRYICRIDMCYTFFTTQRTLKEHQLIHTGKRPLICKVCGRAFRHKAVLYKHLRTHTGEKPYCCKQCPKTFSRLTGVKEHQSIHSGVKPYVCEVCKQAFRIKRHLTGHLLTHTKEKPFSCAHCAYKASRKGHLKKHLSKCFQKHGFEDQHLLTSNNSVSAEIE